MPELPEVELIANGLFRSLKGKQFMEAKVIEPSLVVIKGKRQKKADFCEDYFNRKLVKKRVENIYRKGKMIAIDFEENLTLLFHLKMTGNLLLKTELAENDKYERLRLFFSGCLVSFCDKRKFGFVELLDSDSVRKKLEKLGKDALNELNTADELKFILEKSKLEIKKLLIEQTKISGIGNAYASEILYEAGILPTRSANSLDEGEVKALFVAIKKKLREGIEHGGLTLRDFKDSFGKIGRFQEKLAVYNREGQACQRCGFKIKKIKQSGRATYFCQFCQK